MRFSAVLSLALLAFPLAAAADTLQYSFTGTDAYGNSDSFSFTLASNPTPSSVDTTSAYPEFDLYPVTVDATLLDGTTLSDPADIAFTPDQLINISFPYLSSADFFLSTSTPLYSGSPYSPTLLTGQFLTTNGGEVDEYSYVSGISGTLSVTDLDLAATPEPSSLVLLATGLAGAAGMIRRRRS